MGRTRDLVIESRGGMIGSPGWCLRMNEEAPAATDAGRVRAFRFFDFIDAQGVRDGHLSLDEWMKGELGVETGREG